MRYIWSSIAFGSLFLNSCTCHNHCTNQVSTPVFFSDPGVFPWSIAVFRKGVKEDISLVLYGVVVVTLVWVLEL